MNNLVLYISVHMSFIDISHYEIVQTCQKYRRNCQQKIQNKLREDLFTYNYQIREPSPSYEPKTCSGVEGRTGFLNGEVMLLKQGHKLTSFIFWLVGATELSMVRTMGKI